MHIQIVMFRLPLKTETEVLKPRFLEKPKKFTSRFVDAINGFVLE